MPTVPCAARYAQESRLGVTDKHQESRLGVADKHQESSRAPLQRQSNSSPIDFAADAFLQITIKDIVEREPKFNRAQRLPQGQIQRSARAQPTITGGNRRIETSAEKS